ncbi:MAG: diguanylate cyclase [Lachnospiraceae bacterium]|nr:diguanylate cyclase [Lachnospiraceae bacterium]
MELLEKIILFDKYRITQKLTADAISTIYLGEHIHTNEYVLIQVLNPAVVTKYDNELSRFFSEMNLVRNFEHSALLRVYDVGSYDDAICIVFEYFDGITLDRYIDEHKSFDIIPALRLISQIATGLRYAASSEVLHRNLRASSILIINKNGDYQAKVMDFGMSYIVDFSNITEADIDSNYGYMAPESTGVLDRNVDQRADLYSLGVILYQILTGILPFHATTLDNMVYKHLAVIAKAPEEINPAIPSEVSNIITKLINKDPDLRYATPNELISDIDRYLCSGIIELPPTDNDVLHGFDRKAKIYSHSRELSQIRDIYEGAFAGSGKFCLIHGNTGAGKSDLMTNIYNDIIQAGFICFRSSFKSQYQMTPYHAFTYLLNEFAEEYGKYDRKLQITEKNRLSAILGGLTSIVTKISPIMSTVLTEAIALPPLDEYKEQQRSMSMLANFLLSLLSNSKPYAIILDDLQYADSSSLSLIFELADALRHHNVCIIASMRDLASSDDNPFLATLVSKLKLTDVYVDIHLRPFNETRMCEYLSDILGLPRSECSILSSYMIEKTDGNPYFTINVLRSMLEDKIISVNNRILEQDWEKLRSVNTETDVNTIINRRINDMDEDAVKLLEIASVMGYEFSLDLLTYITDLRLSDITPWINKAINMQFIDYSSSRNLLSFAHKQVYEQFNNRLSEARKKELHYWIAKGIEAKYVSDLHNQLYRLVYHFLMADNDEGVRRYCFDAAEMARSTNANEEAISYYSKALELMEANNERGTDIWIHSQQALTNLNLLCGHFENAINLAEELLEIMTDPVEKACLLRSIGLGHFRQSHFEDAVSCLTRALKYLGITLPKTDFSLKMSAFIYRRNLALYNKVKSNVTESRIAEKGGEATRRNTDNKREEKIVLQTMETLAWALAYTDANKMNYMLLRMHSYSIKHFSMSPELALGASAISIFYYMQNKKEDFRLTQSLTLNMRKSIGDRFGYARSILFSGIFSTFESELEKSVKNFREAVEVFDKIGDVWESNNSRNYLALSYFYSGNFDKCKELCELVIEQSVKLGDPFTQLLASSTLIGCYAEKGSFIQAEDLVAKNITLNDTISVPYAQAYFYLMCGILYNEEEKYRQAEKQLTLAVELINKNNFVPLLALPAFAHLALAKVHVLEEDHTELVPEQLIRRQAEIAILCKTATARLQDYPNHIVTAFRANAILSIMRERTKHVDTYFKKGLEHASFGGNTFEAARLHFEYGKYLFNKHRIEESRFNIFEAYMNFSAISSTQYIKRCEDMITEKYSQEFRDNSLLADVTAKRNRMNVDRKVNSLLRVGERLTSTIEIEELQNKILQDAVELSGAERGILFLYPENGEKKLYIASVFNTGNYENYSYDWMLEEIELTRQPIVINDVQSDEFRRNYTDMVRYGIKSVMAIPMFVRGKLYGIIYLDSRLVRGIFSSEYMETLGFIANQGGAPIENARLYHRAITDGLTQLYGRSYLDNLIIDKTSDPQKAKLSALMLDVDFFKKCNDTYGHQFGDEVLKQVAGIMKRIAGAKGTACRYGGEEFVVLIDSDNADYAMNIAERIRQTIETTSVAYNSDSKVTLVSITISVGVSVWTPDMERVELIEHADKALYYAKHNGRNQVQLWSADMK